MTKFEIEEKIVAMLKTVYDPEIPVDVYNLGLIYKIEVTDDFGHDADRPQLPRGGVYHGGCAPKAGIH